MFSASLAFPPSIDHFARALDLTRRLDFTAILDFAEDLARDRDLVLLCGFAVVRDAVRVWDLVEVARERDAVFAADFGAAFVLAALGFAVLVRDFVLEGVVPAFAVPLEVTLDLACDDLPLPVFDVERLAFMLAGRFTSLLKLLFWPPAVFS